MNEKNIDNSIETKNKDYVKQIDTKEKPYTIEVNWDSKVDLLEILELFLCPSITI